MDWSEWIERWTTIIANSIVIVGAVPVVRWARQLLFQTTEIRRRLAGIAGDAIDAKVDYQHISLVNERSPNVWDIQWSRLPIPATPPDQVKSGVAVISAPRLRRILAENRRVLGDEQIVVGGVQYFERNGSIERAEIIRLDHAQGDPRWRSVLFGFRRWLAGQR